MYKLYLDDERIPTYKGWIVVRSFTEFVETISKNGLPNEMSLDHDLGKNVDTGKLLPTGMDCLKWLIYDQQFDISGVNINIHSSNYPAKLNMESFIKSYIRSLKL